MRLALVAAVLLAGASRQDDVKKLLSDAERVKKLAKKIPPDARAKIEKALGQKIDDKDLSPVLYEAYSLVSSISSADKTRCIVTLVTGRGPKGTFKVGVATAVDDRVLHVVKILENSDDKAIENKHFLEHFQAFDYTESVYNGPDALADAGRLAQGKDAKALELALLLKMNRIMWGVGPHWERMMEKLERKDKSAVDEIGPMEKAFTEGIKLADGARFLRDSQKEKFAAYSEGAVDDFKEVRKLAQAGDYEGAHRKAAELESSRCARCHGSYRRYFRDQRAEHGIGNGLFSTKLDVSVTDPKAEASYQAFATAVKKAILLSSEAK